MTLSTEPPGRDSPTATVPPIQRDVTVAASPETAFAPFTAHLGQWWPLGRFSVFGADALVALEGDQVVERLGDQTSVWAEVTAWDPPHSFALSWHPGRSPDAATDLSISFVPRDDGTLVRLVHSGWERTESPAEVAAEYGQGWPGVFGLFVAATASTIDHGLAIVGGPARHDTDDPTPPAAEPTAGTGTWFALVHTPGPVLDDGVSIFTHPAFGEHLAFLERLRERGLSRDRRPGVSRTRRRDGRGPGAARARGRRHPGACQDRRRQRGGRFPPGGGTPMDGPAHRRVERSRRVSPRRTPGPSGSRRRSGSRR